MREDPIREALSLRFRTNAEQAGVGLDMKASGERPSPGLFPSVFANVCLSRGRHGLWGMRTAAPDRRGGPSNLDLLSPWARPWGDGRPTATRASRSRQHACSSNLPQPGQPPASKPSQSACAAGRGCPCAGAMHPLSSEVVKACLPGGQRKAFRHNMMALMTVTGAKGSVVNFSQISCLLGQQVLRRGGARRASAGSFRRRQPAPASHLG